MNAALGDKVIALVSPAINNETDVAPAFVTRVREDGLVNIKVLLDEMPNLWLTAVKLVDERPTADELAAEFPDTPTGHSRVAWPSS